MPTVLLLRHGQSEWNDRRRWQGSLDSPLTSLGRTQAEAAAARLASLPAFDSVVASDLGRAVETAEIITRRLALAVATTDRRWREADAGAWQGRLVGEIERDWPGWLAAGRRPSDFEPRARVVARAESALADLVGGRHLVLTHSGLIRALVGSRSGVERRVPNLDGVWFQVTEGEITVGASFTTDAAPPAGEDRLQEG